MQYWSSYIFQYIYINHKYMEIYFGSVREDPCLHQGNQVIIFTVISHYLVEKSRDKRHPVDRLEQTT